MTRLAPFLLLALMACADEGPKSTPERTIESSLEQMRQRNVKGCAETFLTEDFRWGTRDREAAQKVIEGYLKDVEDFTVTVTELETKEVTEIDAEFQLQAIVGLKVKAGSGFAGLPLNAVRIAVDGELRFTEDGWRISTFTVR